MALTSENCCPEYPDDWVCEKLDLLLNQYKNSPKLCGIIQAMLEEIDIVRCVLIKECNKTYDCTEAEGDELDAIGNLVGFPRCHCNAICDPCSPIGVSDYCLSDDEYCAFIQAQIITNRGGCTVADMQAAIEALWGDTAQVVHSGNGSVGVWPGRALTNQEKALYALYKKVLPVCLGVNLVVYDTDEPIPSWCCPDDLWCEAVPPCILEDCTRLRPTNLSPLSLCVDFCECGPTIPDSPDHEVCFTVSPSNGTAPYDFDFSGVSLTLNGEPVSFTTDVPLQTTSSGAVTITYSADLSAYEGVTASLCLSGSVDVSDGQGCSQSIAIPDGYCCVFTVLDNFLPIPNPITVIECSDPPEPEPEPEPNAAPIPNPITTIECNNL